MNSLQARYRSPVALGMASLVIGTIGLLFAVFPVLGVPVSAAGLLLGIVGVLATWSQGGVRLRWSLAGIALAATALAINVGLAYAPWGYLPEREVTKPWQSVPDQN